MRITDSLKTNSLLYNVENSLSNLNTVQQQISTGKKVNSMADDPAGASQSLALRASLLDNAQYQRDADQAKSFLSSTDSALNSANSLIQQARQIAVQGANSTNTAESFNALSAQVDGIIQQLTTVANSDLHGKYLFGGTQTKAAPFDASQNYVGDSGSVTATLGPNNQLTLNQPGSAVFGTAFAALKTLKSDLAAGNVSAVSSDIAGMDTALTATATAQANVGAKMNDVTSITQRLTKVQGEYTDSISKIEDVDLAQAYVQLQSSQNVYQAALSTTAKAFQYSLADYLH